MSITVQINAARIAGKLFFWPPTIVSNGVGRDVFVSKDVCDFLRFDDGIDQAFAAASGRALAKVDTFASGKHVVFALDPHIKSPASLVARNAPPRKGVVDLRVTAHKPDVRIFGCFAQCDVLILLTWAPKTGLHYASEVKRCKAAWDALFPTIPPHIGTQHDHYISSNCIAG